MQKTAYEMRTSDWSSDVCSSDLFEQTGRAARFGARYRAGSDEVAGARAGAVDGKMRKELRRVPIHMREVAFCYPDRRSDERRVGKECVSMCRSRGSANN